MVVVHLADEGVAEVHGDALDGLVLPRRVEDVEEQLVDPTVLELQLFRDAEVAQREATVPLDLAGGSEGKQRDGKAGPAPYQKATSTALQVTLVLKRIPYLWNIQSFGILDKERSACRDISAYSGVVVEYFHEQQNYRQWRTGVLSGKALGEPNATDEDIAALIGPGTYRHLLEGLHAIENHLDDLPPQLDTLLRPVLRVGEVEEGGASRHLDVLVVFMILQGGNHQLQKWGGG